MASNPVQPCNDTHVAGAFLLSEALLPHMIPGQSSIIHMSSIRADQSEPNTEVHSYMQLRNTHITPSAVNFALHLYKQC